MHGQSATITFLFTDIEASTQLWEQHPAGMQAALARHDRLLREAIEVHHGHVIKTTGDGCHAAFETAASAVSAVLAAQQALWADAWPEMQPQALRVRMALHTGEAERRAGDYFGPAVNRAARLLSIGHGGQILLSAVTAELVRDQLPPGARLADLGQHQLKDLVRPEHVYQLGGSGLPSDFPPLRSLSPLRHNLPAQLTSFIGRETELAEVHRLLAANRLLTLTGPGGTGKTRLALQAAADCVEAFPHGAWLVELAPLADPALLPQAVAGVLNVQEQRGRSVRDGLLDYLRPKSLLLLLDNCEHLIAACAQLAGQLLQACPQLTILATSREALSLAGEAAYRVPSLSLEAPGGLAGSEAVRLFADRAQAVQPRFRLGDHNLRAVAHICQRLDGIPLAIELAAARVRLLSIDQIAERLDDRFRLLTGGSRAALERHQTLRALIDWSYDLLAEPERAAWRQLSVFAGGFTVEAAEAVIGAEALDWLSHLVDKSLLIAEEDPGGQTRFRMLETMRQYGGDKLLEAGETQAARDRHLACYARMVREAEPRLRGPAMLAALNQLEQEHDNVRAGLEWGLSRDPPAALQMATDLNYFWRRRGYGAEGLQWLAEALARVPATTPAATAQRAAGLVALGNLCLHQGLLRESRVRLEEAVVLSRQAGERATLALALGGLSLSVSWLGDHDLMKALLTEAAALVQEINDEALEAQLLDLNAQLAFLSHDHATARASIHRALALLQRAGNPWQLGITLMGLGMLDEAEGRLDEARHNLLQAERNFRHIGDASLATGMLSHRAHLERRAGNLSEAAAQYARTIQDYLEIGHRAAVLHEVECLAFIAIRRGQAAHAARLLGAAEALRDSANSPMTAAERVEYDEHLAALRAQANVQTIAAAWQAGRALSLEAAVALAVQAAEPAEMTNRT
jgi:predicted ATPase/class 3 adenylate cyclase